MSKIIWTLVLLLCLACTGCDKFLEEKPRKGLVVPEKLEQLLSLMRKENESMEDPIFGELSADDYFWDEAYINGNEEPIRNAYRWMPDNMFGNTSLTEWNLHYRFIYYTNTVLEQLPNIQPSAAEQPLWNKAKGEALFYRGKFLYDLAIIWASAANAPNSDQLLGMPLRLNTNFNERSFRSSLRDTYAQIVNDIEASILYLPDVAEHVTRPSKRAAQAMAARIFLSMGAYEKALFYAQEVLKVQSDLLDFKTLSTTASYPIASFNKEVILHAHMQLAMSNVYLNPSLFHSYADTDLRKAIYFQNGSNGKISFKGSYYGRSTLFAGLAVDEMYLIAAECQARASDLVQAKANLVALLDKRYAKDKTPVLDGLSKTELIDYILNERRKELLFRGLRWGDVKRLNNEERGIPLQRFAADGSVVSLKANDLRFNLPIPERLLDLSDMIQNPR